MNIVVVGLNHKTAPIEVRERLTFSSEKNPLEGLMKLKSVEEGVILSTCNRVELCVLTQNVVESTKEVKQFISEFHDESISLDPHVYCLEGKSAVQHVFRVASSLDSMVVGEPQILGQVKQSYHDAKSAKTLGPVLHRFYHKAFSTAKRVRSETNIGADPVSVGSVSVDLAKKIFDQIDQKVILLVGAGEMIEVAAARLIDQGVSQVYISNRTAEHVVGLTHSLKKDIHLKYLPLESITSYLDKIDIMIVSTASPDYLITKDQIEKGMGARHQRPLFCIDISVPRNVDPAINDIDNVYLYDIDDLEIIVKENLKSREDQAKVAEKIVGEEASQFYEWFDAMKFTPTLRSIRQKVDGIRKAEVEELFSWLPHLSQEDKKRIDKFSQRLSQKMLHDPFMVIKEEAKSNNVRFVEFLKTLFRI